MVQSVRFKNFKAFADTGEIPISQLSCLVGRNSSGKSSLAQALILLKQSIEENTAGFRVPHLVLNGSQYEGGSYEDLVAGHDKNKHMSFTFKIRHEKPKKKLSHRSIYDRPSSIVPVQYPATFELKRLDFRSRWYYGPDLPSFDAEVTYEFRPEKIFGTGLCKLNLLIKDLGEITITRSAGELRESHWRFYAWKLPRKSFKVRFPSGSISPAFRFNNVVYDNETARNRRKMRNFVQASGIVFADIHEFLSDLQMLGPFRTPPNRLYTFTGLSSPSTGLNGQHAINLLITEVITRPLKQRHLNRAVSKWLKYLNIADSINIQQLTKASNLFEVKMQNAGFKGTANFADVGFGISQVLPVIVQGLLMAPKSTFIVQQPELHLHPDAQGGLADFFLFLARCGVNCILETHSEYILVRLRRRLAEKFVPPVRVQLSRDISFRKIGVPDVGILLIHEHGKTGHKVVPITIGPTFQFENMPPNFMDQAIADRIKLMEALK